VALRAQGSLVPPALAGHDPIRLKSPRISDTIRFVSGFVNQTPSGESTGMFRLTAIILILMFFLPAIIPWTIPAVLSSLSGPSEAWAQTDQTELMQQSDYKRRAAKQGKPEPGQQQTAGVIPVETGARDGDYVVLAILVASVVILAFVAARGKGSRSKSRYRPR